MLKNIKYYIRIDPLKAWCFFLSFCFLSFSSFLMAVDKSSKAEEELNQHFSNIDKRTKEFTSQKRSKEEIYKFQAKLLDETRDLIMKNEKSFAINDSSRSSTSAQSKQEEQKKKSSKKTFGENVNVQSDTPKVMDFGK